MKTGITARRDSPEYMKLYQSTDRWKNYLRQWRDDRKSLRLATLAAGGRP